MGRNFKKKIIRAVSLVLAAALSVCMLSSCTPGEKRLYRFTDVYYDAFDTVISVIAYCESQQEFAALSERVHSEFMKFHRLFDVYNEYEGIVNAASMNRLARSRSLKNSSSF